MLSKIVNIRTLVGIRRRLREGGRTVVLTNGCFDVLHVGHVRYLCQARALGDCLIVGLNSDASVRRLKGKKRPLVPEGERAEVLSALSCVDYVIVFDEPTAEKLVAKLKPDVYTKGGDYALDEKEGHESWERKLPEAKAVAAYGGEIQILPFMTGRSTTDLIQTVLERYGTK
ncbi:MAG: D-glycero-beta-D-manno-heptose 1-phosphate adenylyltransferase [Chloroflexi bacterium]|nr:D-glycero-beta-D-manno-heptose 1-phosphate adenylyltransferase [Chloroflexota bacterium]